MNNSQSNFWAGIAVLVFVGICVGLGITTHSAWVPVLTMVGFFVVYRGSAEGMSENIGRFVIFSLAGIILVMVAVVFGSTGKFPTSGWRWLWTPVWLFMCLAPFLASMELKSNNHDSASMLGTILGFLCLAVAIATPLLLPKLQLQDLPGIGKLNLPELLWVVWLALGLVSARLAYLHGDAMNPARFSLFALGAVAFLGWATYSSGLPGRWVWAIPWLIAVGMLYYGAKEVKLFRDWAGNLGYLLTLLSVAGAVLAVLWFERGAEFVGQLVATAFATFFLFGRFVILGGEISSKGRVHYEDLVRDAIREIGYVDASEPFCADTVHLLSKGRFAFSGSPRRTLTPEALRAVYGVPFRVAWTRQGPHVSWDG